MNNSILKLLAATFIMSGCSYNTKQTKSAEEKKDSLTLILGSYCNTEDEGIKIYTFNEDNAGFTYKSGLSGISNPSFLSDIYDGKFIFSVAEDDNQNAAALSLEYNNYSISKINIQETNGKAPCNIAAWKDSKSLFTANYNGGNISVFDIKDNGEIVFNKTIDFKGKGLHKTRQTTPHIHSINFTPDGKQLWANDLGTDRIRVINLKDNSHCNNDDIQLPQGSGPRHTCFLSNGKFAYIITELSGDVLVLNIKKDSKPELIQTIKADTLMAEGSADIHLSPDEKFLYASCRLKSDGIAIFSVDSIKGTLKRVGYCLTGKHPRNFAITPNGKFVLVACRDENAVEIYSRNENNGQLTNTGKKITMKAPVCVRWIK